MAKLSGLRLVAEIKVAGYLLDHTHPTGKSKARFFGGFGFDKIEFSLLTLALLDHPNRNEIVHTEQSELGEKSIVQCRLSSPDARDPCIRSVWFREHGSSVHRLVTAYPAPAN